MRSAKGTPMSGALCCDLLAETRLGPLRMSVPLPSLLGGRERFDNVDIALAMARCEPLLREFEHWLGEPIDPAPVHASMPDAPGLTATVRDAHLAPAGTVFRWPWEALLHKMPPRHLLAPHVSWPMLQFEAELAHYDEPPVERAALRPDSLLLLPQAFQATWNVQLHNPREGIALNVRWDAKEFGPPHLLSAVRLASHRPAAWRVVLKAPVEASAQWAFGWQAGAALAMPNTWRACLLGPDSPQPWAEGVIVPALQGAALLIDGFCSNDARPSFDSIATAAELAPA